MMRFDMLCLHTCDTNMVDSNCHQAVSHMNENQELRHCLWEYTKDNVKNVLSDIRL